MKKLALFLLLLITGVFFIGKPIIPVKMAVTDIDPSLDFEFQLLNTSNVLLTDYKSDQFILDFFATWCAPCITQELELYKIHDQFPNVAILSISIEPDDSISILSEYIATNNMTWVVGRDFTNQAAKIFSITSIPTLAYIGYSGNLDHLESGVQSASDLSEWITSDVKTTEARSETSTTVISTTSTTTTVILSEITPGLEYSFLFLWMIGLVCIKSKRTKKT